MGRSLALTAKALRARFEAMLAEHGYSVATWIVLADAIEEAGLSQRQLAERIGVEGPTLTRHLDRMEAEGLIRRRRDEADRRILRVDPTDEGRRVYATLHEAADRVETELLRGLSDRDVTTLRRLLDRVRENVENAEVEHAGAARR